MKKWEEILEKRWAAYTMATCSAVLLYAIISNFGNIINAIRSVLGVFSSIFIGIVIAYLINPLSEYFERKVFRKIKKEKVKHKISVVISLIFVIAMIVLLLVAVIPSLIDSVGVLAGNMETYVATAQKYADSFSKTAARFGMDTTKMNESWNNIVGSLMSKATENMGDLLHSSINMGTAIVNVFVGFILAVYFLMDRDTMLRGVDKLRGLVLTNKSYKIHNSFFRRCNDIVLRYLGFDILDAIIVGLINAILMLIFGIPYIPVISFIVGITNLVPTFGPIVGAALGALLLVLIDPVQALIFLIFTVILQTIDGYVLKPRMFGQSLGVPAVWILVTIILGGKIFGVIGIILAIPFAAIFTFFYDEWVIPKLQARKKRMEKVKEEVTEE